MASNKKRFIKVLEHCESEDKAWEASIRLLKTMNLSPAAKLIYSIGAYYTNGTWTASLFKKDS